MNDFDFDNMSGDQFKSWRESHGLTREQLSLLLEIKSRQTIHNWEHYDVKLPRVVRLALMALEYMPDKTYFNVGKRASRSEAAAVRKRAP